LGKATKKENKLAGPQACRQAFPGERWYKVCGPVFWRLTMKKKDFKIEVGGVYSDEKGGEREVIGIGPEFKLYDSQENEDCLRYKLTAKKRGPYPVGYEGNCTTAAFRSWCKKRIE
jgi:hypothetical protein